MSPNVNKQILSATLLCFLECHQISDSNKSNPVHCPSPSPSPHPSYRSILSINPTAPIAAPKMKYLPTPLRIYWTSLDDVNTLNQWTDKPNLIKITCSCSTTICVSDFNLTNCKRKWYKRVVYGWYLPPDSEF